jgi:hypothetical protein
VDGIVITTKYWAWIVYMVGYELGLGLGYRSNLCTNILDHSKSISIELTRNTSLRNISIS